MQSAMHGFFVTLMLAGVAPGAPTHADAQERPDSAARTEYDALTDSTTRSRSAYAVVDTSVTPADTFAVELSQRWKGRGTSAPAGGPVELALGRARATGLSASRTLVGTRATRPTVVFRLDGARQIRLEQIEYVSNGGRSDGGGRMTFETARYRLSPAELRLIAESRALRVRIGDRELWIDPAWQRVAAEMAAAGPSPGAAREHARVLESPDRAIIRRAPSRRTVRRGTPGRSAPACGDSRSCQRA